MKKIKAADGKDYVYNKYDKNWRVRVRVNSEIETRAPINGEAAVETAGLGLAVSVALLDEEGNVAVDPYGRFRVFPAHVVTLIPESFAKIDPSKEIEKVIQKQIDEANSQLEGKDKLYKVLAQYK